MRPALCAVSFAVAKKRGGSKGERSLPSVAIATVERTTNGKQSSHKKDIKLCL